MLPVYVLDIVTEPESEERPKPEERRTPPPLSDPPLPPSNDRYHLIVLPEPEVKRNVPSIPPAD